MTLLSVYSKLTALAAPFLKHHLKKRSRNGKEDPARLSERWADIARPRPGGQLLWVHGASVGETLSALPVIERLLAYNPDLCVLVTSGTVTSAELLQSRLPERCFHQYIPLDVKAWTDRFLDHWRPDCVIWLESDFWPNLLTGIQARKIPAILLNARVSERSMARWQKFTASIRMIETLLKTFSICHAQTADDSANLRKLGADNIIVADTVKYAAKPLPFDKHDLSALSLKLADRQTFLYASTHDGEEEMAARIHKRLKKTHPNLLTLILPRHPERRHEIQTKLEDYGLNIQLRGPDKTLPDPQTDLYIMDTLGETGMAYRACPMAFIGRSLSKDGGGGHNPFEAMQLGCVVLFGPHVQNFENVYRDIRTAKAGIAILDEVDLMQKYEMLYNETAYYQSFQNAANKFVNRKQTGIDDLMKMLAPTLHRAGLLLQG